MENPEEGKVCDFQSSHIIRFKCPVINRKNHRAYKERESMAHSKGKKIRNYPLKKPDGRSTRQITFVHRWYNLLYVENSQDTTKLVRINEFNKGCKTNTEKSDAFLYTNNEQSESEIMKKNPFIIASIRIKYLGINLTKVKTCAIKATKHC